MAKYRLTCNADQDFFDIYVYGVQMFGVRQAEAYVEGLQLRFQEIADLPWLYQAIDHISAGYRRSVYRSHTIYYRQDGADVLIVRILRGQDLLSALV